MIFDIQDVGVRFYTYISTLHYVMEACAENNIKLIVLDRPNPNGHYVDGPVLDLNYKSFIGMHPVPIVHGMTIGEYAQMINGEGWLKSSVVCELEVIECMNYTHETFYSLPIPPSPNLRSDRSIQLYASLCLLEGTVVSIGRGTDNPFEKYGHPDFPAVGYEFIPKSNQGSKNPKFKGTKCNGYNLVETPFVRVEEINLSYVMNSYEHIGAKLFSRGEKNFNRLAGNDKLIQQIKSKTGEEQIRASWESGLNKFNKTRKKYLLYE